MKILRKIHGGRPPTYEVHCPGCGSIYRTTQWAKDVSDPGKVCASCALERRQRTSRGS